MYKLNDYKATKWPTMSINTLENILLLEKRCKRMQEMCDRAKKDGYVTPVTHGAISSLSFELSRFSEKYREEAACKRRRHSVKSLAAAIESGELYCSESSFIPVFTAKFLNEWETLAGRCGAKGRFSAALSKTLVHFGIGGQLYVDFDSQYREEGEDSYRSVYKRGSAAHRKFLVLLYAWRAAEAVGTGKLRLRLEKS